jgi:hypothetical protein
MKPHQFSRIVANVHDRSKKVLIEKAAEYTTDDDRLSNFKKAGGLTGDPPEKALLGMLVKHWVSLVELIDGLKSGKNVPIVMWQEKITDSINYSILLEALVWERFFDEEV